MTEILEHRMGKPVNLRKIDDFIEASKRFFRYNQSDYMLCSAYNCLSEKYRELFATTFCLHFLLDEIGQETEYMFEMCVTDKLYESYQFINKTFEIAEKGPFAKYTITTHDNHTDSNGNESNITHSVTNGNESEEHQDSENGGSKVANTEDSTDSSNQHVADARADHSEDNVAHDSVTNTNDSANDTDEGKKTHTGAAKTKTSDTKRIVQDGKSNENTHSEYEKNGTKSDNGTVNVINNSTTTPTDGSDTETHHMEGDESGSSKRDLTSSGSYDLDHSFSATPQNGLIGVKSGKYLTNAAVDNRIESKTDAETNSDTRTHSGDETITRIRAQGENVAGSQDTNNNSNGTWGETGSDDGTKSGTSNIKTDEDNAGTVDASDNYTDDDSNIHTHSAESDSTTKGKDDSVHNGTSNGTTDTVNKSSGHKSGVQDAEHNVSKDGTSSKQSSTDSSGTSNTDRSDNSHDQGITESFEYTFEMLRESENVLKKVWELFDDCFLGIC